MSEPKLTLLEFIEQYPNSCINHIPSEKILNLDCDMACVLDVCEIKFCIISTASRHDTIAIRFANGKLDGYMDTISYCISDRRHWKIDKIIDYSMLAPSKPLSSVDIRSLL